MVEHLSPYLQLSQFRPELLDSPCVIRPLPKPRMHGKPFDVLEYLRQLHVRRMTILVHPARVPPAGDQLPVPPAGAFGVSKDELQREITNMMGRNATQLNMKSANLPQGTMFTQIVLPPGKVPGDLFG